MIKTTTANRNMQNSAQIREVLRRLFKLSVHLYVERCTCEKHARRIGANGKSIG
jgi:hypothetical protein